MRWHKFISLLGSAAAAWSFVAHAADIATAPTTDSATAKLPEIDGALGAFDPAAPNQLASGQVDLMKGISLSSAEGIGAVWKTPPYIAVSGDSFDERYGRW